MDTALTGSTIQLLIIKLIIWVRQFTGCNSGGFSEGELGTFD
jgi:hypothetical protein